MCSGSGTGGCCCSCAETETMHALTRCERFSARSDVMAAILNVWRQIENPSRYLMRIYIENIPAKFHPHLISNDGALGLFQMKKLP